MKNINLIVLALFSLVLVSCGSSSSSSSSSSSGSNSSTTVVEFSLAENSTFELTEGATEDLLITITSNEAVATTDLDNVSFTATFNLSYGTATTSDFSTTADTREVTGDVTIESDSSTNTATLTINTADLEILADDILETDETFDLRLTALEVSSDLFSATTTIDTAKNRITVTIANDDKVELSIADAVANEDKNLIFTVTVSGDSEIAIPFSYEVTATGDNSASTDDFVGDTFPSSTDTISAGSSSKTITIDLKDDDLVEDAEAFALSLSSTNTDVIADATATGTIEDNDRANLTISGGRDIIEGGVSSVFVVTIDKATQIELTATYTVEGTGDNPATATDFTTGGTTKTVTFPANSTAGTTQPFTLETVDNDVISDNKEFFLQFSTNENSLTGNNSANFVIFDDDNNGAIILANQTVVEGATIDLEFSVNPSAFNGGVTTVTIIYEIELGGDATATIEDFTNLITTGTVVLTTAVPQQTITVATATDEIIEEDQSFSVVITETTPASVLASTSASNRSRAITIIDDDEATLTLGRDGGNEIAEGVAGSTTAATFTVSLASEQTTEIDLDFTITAGGSGDNPTTATDFGGTFPTKPITITAGDATTNFSISVAGDAALEYNEQFTFTASGANFGSLVISGDVFTIKNDDRVTLSITPSTLSTREDAGSVDFTLSVTTGESAIAIPFSYSVTASGDKPVDADDFGGGAFPSNTDSIAINATTTTINIAINNDDELEETESFLFSLTTSGDAATFPNSFIDFNTATAAVNIENDDRVELLIADAAANEDEDLIFTVTVRGESAIAIPFRYVVTTTGINSAAINDLVGDTFPSNTDFIAIDATTTTINIAINNDDVFELAETFLFSLIASGDAATFPNSFIDFNTATGTIKDDDFRGFSLTEDSTFELTEGTAEVLPITITSNEAVAATNLENVSFTAKFNLSYGTATTSDFSTTADTREVTGDVTIESDSNTSTATLTINTVFLEILADDILEAAETFVLRLTTLEVSHDLLTTAILIDPANNTIVITIKNDDKVELLIADAAANEAENLIFTVTVSGDSEIAIPFSYIVTASGAKPAAADDFIGDAFPSNTITISAGSNSKTITIDLKDDDLVEDAKTFLFSLAASGDAATFPNSFIDFDTATGTIEDNDTANLTISGGRDIIEGGVSSVFVVTIDKATQIELTATYTVEGTGANPATATDFTTSGTTKTVTFPANSTAGTTQTFTLETVDNDVISDNKEFFLQFSTNENSLTLTGDNSANFVIFDNDNSGAIILANQTVVEGDTIELEFSVNPSAFNGSVTTVTVDYEIELGGIVPATIEDFTNFDATGTVVLTTAEPQQTITVATAADEIIEKDQSFSVVITETTPASVLASTSASNRSRAITIIDDDEATLTLVRDSGNEIAEGEADSTTAAIFTVSLASEQTTEINLDFTITAGGSGDNPTTATDFGGTFPTKPITITAGDATANFSISVAGDTVLEDDEQFIFTASGENFGSLVISGDVFIIKNDDRVTLSVSAVATSVNESANANFTVSFDGESAIAIPFSYSVTASGDKPVDADDFGGGAFPSNTDFIAINATTTTINIAINNDVELEETESFLFSLTASGDAATFPNSFIDFGTPIAAVNIENDDRVTLSITPSTLSVSEGSGRIDFTLSVTTGVSAIAIPFSYSVSATGDKPVDADDFGGGAFLSGTDSLTIGDTITISIAIEDDNVLELAETFLFSLAASGDAATFPNSFIDFNTATGTIENDDFNITTAVGFNSIRNNLAIDYQLLNNLDLAEFANFEPFGEFTGTFEGNGFSIANLTIDRTSDDNVGLFSTLNGATVRNLIIENPQITGDDNVGALAGIATNNTLIDNVGVLADSSSFVTGNQYVGGLVGQNDTSTINNSWAAGSVVGKSFVGGLVGDNYTIRGEALINNSWASGSVVGNERVGGLVGSNFTTRRGEALINNSWASGSVVGVGNSTETTTDNFIIGYFIGGLVGENARGTINNSWATASVITNLNRIGGLVGLSYGQINNSWASGSVTGNLEVGGLVGITQSPVDNSWASGSVSGSGRVGGLVGFVQENSVNSSWASGSVVGDDFVGGLVGFAGGLIRNSYWNYETSGQNSNLGSTRVAGVTTAEMIAATGSAGETAFDNWNFITDSAWNFETTGDYPTIISNGATADFQLVYQVAGQIRLIPATDTNGTGRAFFGDSNIQDELDITADNFAANNTLAIFDLNAQAENTNNRADFSTCTGKIPTAVNENLLTTTGVNGTTVTVIITAGTTNPANWTGTEACGIELVNQPAVGDELNLTVEITKGAETATRQFNITFIESDKGVELLIADAVADEDEDLIFTITVSGDSEIAIPFSYKITATGTNPADVADFLGDAFPNGTGSIAADSTTTTVRIYINDDDAIEGSETFAISLSSGNTAVIVNTATGTIEDNEFFIDVSNDGLFDITTVAEFSSIRNFLTNGYELLNNLDLAVFENFEPFGEFTTTFNGNGFAIKNLTINRNSDDVGLFSRLNGATVRNLIIENPQITGNDFVGALAGQTINSTLIDNVGVLANSSSFINGDQRVGGLVGQNNDTATITNSWATGSVVGNGERVGGLVGQNNDNATINNSWAAVSVFGNERVGGLVGQNITRATINNSWSAGSVVGSQQVGGLIGSNDTNSTINNNWAAGSVVGSDYIGGLVGVNFASTVSDSYWNTETSGQTTSAGDSGVTGVTTAEMIAATGAAGAAFNDWNSITDIPWSFGEISEYPTIISNGATADFQLASQVAAQIRLIPATRTNGTGGVFFGKSNIQDELNVTAADFAAGSTLAIFDLNARARNINTRADFADCAIATPAAVGDTLLTTNGVNDTMVTVTIAADTTNTDWTATTTCGILVGTQPTEAGDKLNLTVKITKDAETATRQFKITFK